MRAPLVVGDGVDFVHDDVSTSRKIARLFSAVSKM